MASGFSDPLSFGEPQEDVSASLGYLARGRGKPSHLRVRDWASACMARMCACTVAGGLQCASLPSGA